VPVVAPVTIPALLTVATRVLLLFQAPPDVPSVRVVEEPEQTEADPFSGGTTGSEPTVKMAVVTALPHDPDAP